MYASVQNMVERYGRQEMADRSHSEPPASFFASLDCNTKTLVLSSFRHAYGTIASGQIDFGDGTTAPISGTVTHSYLTDDVFAVSVSFTDGQTEYKFSFDVDSTDCCFGKREFQAIAVYAPKIESCLKSAASRINTAIRKACYVLPFNAANYPNTPLDALSELNDVLADLQMKAARCCLFDDQKTDAVKDDCTEVSDWLEAVSCGNCSHLLCGLAPKTDEVYSPPFGSVNKCATITPCKEREIIGSVKNRHLEIIDESCCD